MTKWNARSHTKDLRYGRIRGNAWTIDAKISWSDVDHTRVDLLSVSFYATLFRRNLSPNYYQIVGMYLCLLDPLCFGTFDLRHISVCDLTRDLLWSLQRQRVSVRQYDHERSDLENEVTSERDRCKLPWYCRLQRTFWESQWTRHFHSRTETSKSSSSGSRKDNECILTSMSVIVKAFEASFRDLFVLCAWISTYVIPSLRYRYPVLDDVRGSRRLLIFFF